MSRIIGCQALHLAEVTKDDLEGVSFDTPKPIPSLVSIDISDNTESVSFYSDDTTEQVIQSFGGKEVSITLGYLSDELEAMITGNTYENGVFTQNANATAKEYALMFRAPLSKGGFQYVCLYKGVLARKEANYATKEESIEGQTVTLEGVFMPLVHDGNVAIKADSNNPEAAELIKDWFKKVPVKNSPAALQVSVKNK